MSDVKDQWYYDGKMKLELEKIGEGLWEVRVFSVSGIDLVEKFRKQFITLIDAEKEYDGFLDKRREILNKKRERWFGK